MALQSKLFSNDPKLEAAAVSDPAHIMSGAIGEHVRKIQQALIQLDGAKIRADGMYGPATAAAVLAYKQKRNIINPSYQTAADDIVGKMTVAAMDKELLASEIVPDADSTCTLDFAVPPDAGGHPVRAGVGVLGLVGDSPSAPSEADIMAEALRFGRQCLRDARGDLQDLAFALSLGNLLADAQEKTFTKAIKWLNLNRADTAACITNINSAADLIVKNLLVKTSSGGEVVMTHAVGKSFWGQTTGSPDRGFAAGDPFFSRGGPNCRRDVVIHEFFHLVGVHHGGSTLDGPTIRENITTPAQALDSADNLTQLVADLRTFKDPNTDACVRPKD